MAYSQKEYKTGTDDQDSASTISYDMGDKQEGDNLTSRKVKYLNGILNQDISCHLQ